MSPDNEIDRAAEETRILSFWDETQSKIATDFVKHIGESLVSGFKDIAVNVIYIKHHNAIYSITGGPTVQVVIGIDHTDKDFKKICYDIAKAAVRSYNPVEVPGSHKVLLNKKEKLRSKRGEMEWLVPLKFLDITIHRSVTVKGPDGVSITVEDPTGRKLESDLIWEARVKVSKLLLWDNKEEEEE